MYERRQFERRATSIRVELRHPSMGVLIGKASDISDGGLAVWLEPSSLPPVGTVLSAKLSRVTGAINQDPVDMKVVHHGRGGLIGLKFV